MSDANKRLVRRYYEEVVSTGDVDAVPSFIAVDYTEVHEGTRYPLGVEGARAHITGVRATYGDVRLTVDRQIAEGDWVVSMVTMRGRHVGEWMGIAPTGRDVVMTGVNVDCIVDGRIVEHGGAANLLGPLMQIGAITLGAPPPTEPRPAD